MEWVLRAIMFSDSVMSKQKKTKNQIFHDTYEAFLWNTTRYSGIDAYWSGVT
jgi:hypothetical protein